MSFHILFTRNSSFPNPLTAMPFFILIKKYSQSLMQLEFHLADHCNLNCKGCSHFPTSCHSLSFRIKNSLCATFSNLPAISRRFMIFICSRRTVIKPEIGVYINTVRKAFPYTNLIIVTNGLLLLSLKEEVIQMIKENRVHISISDYTCLDRDKIISFIQAHALSADLREGKSVFHQVFKSAGGLR